MNEKLVSIIMPVYNAERFLHQAIQSILDQTYKNFELVIIDDGSTDSSSKIIKNFSDERIRSSFFENQGVSKARNVGISLAHGEFIALMDADDISEPTRIQKQIQYLNDNHNISIVGTNAIFIDEEGSDSSLKNYPTFHSEIEFVAPLLGPMCFPTMMIYKDCLIDIGGYQDNLIVSGDHDLLLRLLSKNYVIHNYQEFLYKYRICKSSLSHTKNELQKSNHYNSSKLYLDELLKSGNCSFYDYRRGLLEYYYGDILVARSFLRKALGNKLTPKLRLIRLLISSILGNRGMRFLRKNGISQFINKMIFRLFSFNLQNVKIKKVN